MAETSLHPLIDNGIVKGLGSFDGGTLFCRCPSDKVEVTISGDVAHNHACGCSKCWKPEGALFSVVGVVPVDKLNVSAHPEKLSIVDPAAAIQRHACKTCGVHMYGRIEKDHPFKGLDFVHVELSDKTGWQAPQFAAFVSSIIEQGFEPAGMDAVRSKFHSAGIETYDCLSPPLMDAIASYTASKAPAAAAPASPAPSAPAPAAPPAPAPAATPKPAPSTAASSEPKKKGFLAWLFGG